LALLGVGLYAVGHTCVRVLVLVLPVLSVLVAVAPDRFVGLRPLTVTWQVMVSLCAVEVVVLAIQMRGYRGPGSRTPKPTRAARWRNAVFEVVALVVVAGGVVIAELHRSPGSAALAAAITAGIAAGGSSVLIWWRWRRQRRRTRWLDAEKQLRARRQPPPADHAAPATAGLSEADHRALVERLRGLADATPEDLEQFLQTLFAARPQVIVAVSRESVRRARRAGRTLRAARWIKINVGTNRYTIMFWRGRTYTNVDLPVTPDQSGARSLTAWAEELASDLDRSAATQEAVAAVVRDLLHG
jgi:hypothetical protein